MLSPLLFLKKEAVDRIGAMMQRYVLKGFFEEFHGAFPHWIGILPATTSSRHLYRLIISLIRPKCRPEPVCTTLPLAVEALRCLAHRIEI